MNRNMNISKFLYTIPDHKLNKRSGERLEEISQIEKYILQTNFNRNKKNHFKN